MPETRREPLHPREDAGGLTLLDFLRVLRRRKWLILQVLVLTPLAAIYISLQQDRLYEASADVLLSRENLAANLTPGAVDPAAYQQPERVAQTQADLARVPTIVERTLAGAGVENRGVEDFLRSSDVEPKSNSDLLRFRVRDGDRTLAMRLATEYAQEYTNYRRELDTAALVAARRKVEGRIDQLERDGERRSALYASLVQKQEQLETLEALKTSNATLVRQATRADQVQPQLLRNAILAGALAIVLALALAFLWEALDTRLRTPEEIGAALGLPLLARLPAPPAKLRKNDRLVMLGEAHGPEAEAFRLFRTNVEFTNVDGLAKTMMITSALPAEGKSTTVANLAVALARAGKHVVLVDLDLRRPYLDRFFDLQGQWGVTEVALGHVPLSEALVPVPLRSAVGDMGRNGGRGDGKLEVLTSGVTPPDPGEFIASHALERVLAELGEGADLVLVDAPPALGVGDAMSLSAKVDAIIVVVHAKLARRPVLKELRRLLDATTAHTLGYVLAGAEIDEAYGYAGYAYTGGKAKDSLAPETLRAR